MEDVELLGPHISRALDCNHWIEEMTTGLLQHCVAVLKLCHLLTEKVTKIPLVQQKQQQRPAELNEFICKATTQIVPRFEALLRSMASKEVEIRVLEARVGALSSACWSLVVPLSLASPKHKDQLVGIVQEMDFHMTMLQMALNKANELEEEQREELTNKSQLAAASTSQLQGNDRILRQEQQPNGRILIGEDGTSKARDSENEAVPSLLADEAPADPATQ
ncbi:hypothetical protein niasHS_017711 [Heterodera schachtii]|uniref:Transmembrane protein 98 n=2 Tax=Heterodera TaxID=34509 RepID=A0ABD2I4B4_HETSC